MTRRNLPSPPANKFFDLRDFMEPEPHPAPPAPVVAEGAIPEHWKDRATWIVKGANLKADERGRLAVMLLRTLLVAKPVAPPVVAEGLTPSSPEEVAAFEAWAIEKKYDMTTHPLHWLFLNEKTYAARQGWKAGLAFAHATAAVQKDRADQKGQTK